jgi:endonuclease I
MKKIALLLTLVLFTFSTQSQDWFSFSPDSLNFGSFSPGIADTKMVVITYTGRDTAFTIKPYAPAVYGTYHPYTVLNELTFDENGSSDTMWVAFASNQNLNYDTYITLSNKLVGAHRYRVKGRILFPKTYYGSTFDLREEALKDELSSLISGHTNLGYNVARDKMFMSIDNWKTNGRGSSVNKLESIYKADVITNYTSRSDAQNQGWNTEHTYPQSMFNSADPMKSDLHHLFPADGGANSTRGNKPFGEVSGGTPVGSAGSFSSSSTFEPRDFFKGKIARAMIYFYLRYGNMGDFFRPMENTMRQWHEDFPVDVVEENRNQDIFDEQGNRSPFVDYPQFIDRIAKLNGLSENDSSVRVSVWPKDSLVSFDDRNSTNYSIALVNEGDSSLVVDSVVLGGSRCCVNLGGTYQMGQSFAPKDVHLIPIEMWGAPNGEYVAPIDIFLSSGDSFRVWADASRAFYWSVDENEERTISIWPNPVSSSLNLKLERKESYQINNPEGRLVLQGFTDSSIDVSDLGSGIYFLSLPDLSRVVRFVKQ